MATIMCTKELWRSLGGQGTLLVRPDSDQGPAKLAVWGVKSVALPEGLFCVALNETTYLTLVFRHSPLPEFLARFAGALMRELEHLGVPGPVILSELNAAMGRVQFARHSSRSLLGSINDVAFHLAWALEHEGRATNRTLDRIQHKLNRMPHVNREMPFPDEATSLLFSGGGGEAA